MTQKKRNLFILWFANFFVSASLTMILPFISLYVATLGDFSDEYVQRWSGIIFGISFLTAFFFSPIWGRLGDQKGRKKIAIILGAGVTLSILLMGFAQSVWQLFFLRMFMGLFSGFISMTQALAAAQTERHEAGKVLGTLQTGNMSGMLFGPLLGGVMADSLGFQYTFIVTAIIVAMAPLAILFGIKEIRLVEKGEDQHKKYSAKEVLQHIFSTPALLSVMIVSTLIQAANFSIQPLLALFVEEIHGSVNLAFYSGLAFSALGLGNLCFARTWGKLGDRVGYGRIMTLLCFAAAIVALPQAWVTSIWQLIVLRFLLGICIGGINPARAAFIRNKSPNAIQGEIFGYNMSFRFLGNVTGPLCGGFLASFYGYSVVFYFMSFLLLLGSGLLILSFVKEGQRTKKLAKQ